MSAFEELRGESPLEFIEKAESKLGDVKGFDTLEDAFKSKFNAKNWEGIDKSDVLLMKTQSYEAEMRAGMLAKAFGKIAETIEKMKSLLEDVKSLALGKLMEKSDALKNAVKELVQAGKMSEKTKNLMNRISQWFGKEGVKREEDVVEDIEKQLKNGADANDLKDALEDVKEDSGIAGKPEKERELIDAEEYAIKEVGLTEEKAKIFHEALRHGLVSEADKTDGEFLKKVAEYIKHWNGNPLDAGKHTVVKFFKADGVTTKVSGHSIEDFAVLKEGVHNGPHDGWGWTHIWEEELRECRFHAYYLKKFGLDLKGEALQRKILEDMENTLRYGEKVKIDDITLEFRYGDIRVRVSINEKNMGSIQTAFPNT